MASRRPTDAALAVEEQLSQRATSAGQGNRTRAREHGDLAMYQWGPTGKDRANGCRCELCVEGNRAYKRRHARQRYQGRGGGFVAVSEVRPHVRRLMRLGWNLKQIAHAAQVEPAAVSRISHRAGADDDVKRHVAQAILAIPPVARHRLRRAELDRAMSDRTEAVRAGEWAPHRDIGRYREIDEWKASAACAGIDPDGMLPGRGDDLSACRALCDACPVKADCAEAGVYEKFGVWGGLSERERRRLRRQRGIRLTDDVDVELVPVDVVELEEAS